MEVGLYFGSFNPIHHGHLIIANYVLQHGGVDQVWFVVSPQNPLKKSGSLLNEYHRLYLVQASIEGETALKASDIEFRLPKPSYTIDTLIYLEEKFPTHRFAVIMGSDSYRNLPAWKNYRQLLKHYSVIVYERPGFPAEEIYEGSSTRVLKAPMLEISSTYIRENVRTGRSVRYLVPEAVRQEIEANGYYKQRE